MRVSHGGEGGSEGRVGSRGREDSPAEVVDFRSPRNITIIKSKHYFSPDIPC